MEQNRKVVSILTPCYNEEENVSLLVDKIKEIMNSIPSVDYEHIFIDNASTDQTLKIIDNICEKDSRVKIIANSRNFGHIRSPYYGLMQIETDAAILMASDFQDPPELIKEFVKKWEEGAEIVMGVKNKSDESKWMFLVRSFYYNVINKLSDIELTKNYTGFGLYDRTIIENLRNTPDPYPYFRGLILEMGFTIKKVYFTQPQRQRGITKNNFFTLYDMAMLGICSHSKIPLRIATLTGFTLSILSFFIAFGYLLAKVFLWYQFPI
ncbi:glycosyltransferase family 2 protein, partial [Bacteriovoracaceae bacterium]|nr:glycosyltransferase family 2 protein [Bacteriovoracaceae bacterium]